MPEAAEGETTAGAEPGMPGNPVTLTDPRVMRALSRRVRTSAV